MTVEELQRRAREIRALYAKLEQQNYGRSWTRQELMLGFVGDVGDLSKLAIGKEGVRPFDDIDEKVKHELADCLWSVLVLADAYGVDIEKSFDTTMARLDARIKALLAKNEP